MIFTATTLARSQSTSQQFRDYGASGRAPCAVSQCTIVPVRHHITPIWAQLLSILWALVASALLSVGIDTSTPINALALSKPADFLPRPSMVVTFVTKVSEATESRLEQYGFSRRSAGAYKYYLGPATDEAIRFCISAGARTDCFAPEGTSNIEGIMAFSITSRILRAAITILAGITPSKTDLSEFDENDDHEEATGKVLVNKDDLKAFAITRAADLPESGIFFPYFDGLTLPDRSYLPNCVIRHFSYCFGKGPKDIAEASKTLCNGWKSFSNTGSGRALSHLVFVFDLGISAGYRVQPVIINAEYIGTVVIGDRVAFLEGSTVHKSTSKEVLLEEVGRMQSHDAAIDRIAEILSAVKTDIGSSITIEGKAISTPRILHDLCRERSLSPEQQTAIREQVAKLKFSEVFLDEGSNSILLSVVRRIVRKEFPPATLPFAYKTNALFTKDSTLSNLAAYGYRAPSVLGTGSQVALPISTGMYSGVKAGDIPGVPIFLKPLQSAYEDWCKVLTDNVITFSHKNKDKMGRLRITAVHRIVPHGTPEGDGILGGLLSLVSGGKGKRKLTSNAEERDALTQEESERIKRRRMKGFGMVGFQAFPETEGGKAPTDAHNADDMETDDFF